MKESLFQNTYGLVVCGGKSSRMGSDKSLLQYFEKPQRYHVYDMLLPFCEKVFISCNAAQVNSIEDRYDFIEDSFIDIGPMAALLSAFTKFPENNILLIGCDYPFLAATELQHFLPECKGGLSAFYSEEEKIYEPLLAWYPSASFNGLKEMYKTKQFSLQYFLKSNNAGKHYPADKNSIMSVDNYADFIKVNEILNP